MATQNSSLLAVQSIMGGMGVPPAQIPEMSKPVLAKAKTLSADENVGTFLKFIYKAETGKTGIDAYRTTMGGAMVPVESLKGGHPRISAPFTQTDGVKNTSSAFGAGQFMPKTWDPIAAKLGITDVTPESQDKVAIQLLKQRGVYEDVKAGNFTKAINGLGKEWASLPSSTYPQGKKTWEQASKIMQEVGGPALDIANYNGKIPEKSKVSAAPVVSEKHVIQAMLPSPQEQMAQAAQVEQQRQATLADVFAQEQSQEEQRIKLAAANNMRRIEEQIGRALDPKGMFNVPDEQDPQVAMANVAPELNPFLAKIIDSV